jgi:hypothetical protein
VVLDVNGERTLPRFERNALRHGPARQSAVFFKAKVVVKPPCIVALDDEDRAFLPPAPTLRAEGLSRLLRVAFSAIFLQVLSGHGATLPVQTLNTQLYVLKRRFVAATRMK